MRLYRILALLITVPVATLVLWLAASAIIYSPEYVKRVLVWQETDQYDYTYNFPQSELRASSAPLPFDSVPEPSTLKKLASAFAVEGFNSFFGSHKH